MSLFMKLYLVIIIYILLQNISYAQKIYSVYNFDPVTITSSRIPTEFSKSSRNITVIDENYIKHQNAESITDLLQNLTDLEFKTRGPNGIQTDVSIRGASNEQTLIMIDGIKVSDPQTAHHSMNIPVNLEDIAQIEILKGNASKIYGPNALGGVINIITKNSEDANGSLSLRGGDFGYKEGKFSYSIPINNFTNRLSVSQKSSDGYIENTDFETRNIFYKAGYKTNSSKYNFSLGYQKKDFGANRFYTPSTTERENTEQFLANVSVLNPTNWGHLSLKLSGRRNYDHFQIPEYSYTNKHTTKMYSAEINGLYQAEKYIINFGSDIGYSEITGLRMNHDRSYFGLFAETIFNATEKLSFSPGMSGYYYEDWGFQLFPGLDIGYQLSQKIRIFSSIGRSFRVPSFTDLYYSGVANMGNADLEPEKAISYEIGGKYLSDNLQSSITVFHRNTTDMIDYSKSKADTNAKYIAMNLPQTNTTGIELSVKYNTKFNYLKSIQLSYSYFNHKSDFTDYDFQHKYSLNNLKHNCNINLNQKLPFDLFINWNLSYQERIYDRGNGRFITNFQTNIPLKQFSMHINITNLFNENYVNFNGLPMPGRWFKLGIKYNFDK